MTSSHNGDRRCGSIFVYNDQSVKRVHAILFGCFGIVFVAIIVTLNVILIKTFFKINKQVAVVVHVSFDLVSVTESDGIQNQQSLSHHTHQTTFEVTFAKMMMCFALAYLAFGSSYNTSTDSQDKSKQIQQFFSLYIKMLCIFTRFSSFIKDDIHCFLKNGN